MSDSIYDPWCPELGARLLAAGLAYVDDDEDDEDDLLTEHLRIAFDSELLDRAYRSPKCFQCGGPLVIDRIQRIGWSPFCEWWCVPVNIDEDEMLEALLRFSKLPVDDDLDLIRDRLYGGFKCRVGENCRHVALDIATYRFTNPETNRPLTDMEREDTWERLIHINRRKRPMIGGGPFCDDAPVAFVKLRAA